MWKCPTSLLPITKMQAFFVHHSKACLSLLLLLGLFPWAYGQELDTSPLKHQQDVQLWTSLEVKREVIKDLSVSLKQAYRMEENISQTSSWFTQLTATYKQSKYLRFSSAYRYRSNQEGNRSRVHGDVVLRYKKKRYTTTLRSRFQRRFESDLNHQDYFRERLKIEYNVRKKPINPYIATEWFYRFTYTGNQWETARWDVGVEWKARKRTYLSAYYRNEREFNVVRPELAHILGLRIKYNWK